MRVIQVAPLAQANQLFPETATVSAQDHLVVIAAGT